MPAIAKRQTISLPALLLIPLYLFVRPVMAGDSEHDVLEFDDSQLEEELVYPDWFKTTLGDLRDDLKAA
ncbi:MAG TPA: hypothetical protein ENJ64_00485, partial [Thiotrichales bacterium]|nr:hypothetical protein [Thiotrichales bacterium]